MQVSQDEGELLTMLARLVGARRAVEVGVFTGYSSICIARGMAAGGHLLACDVSEECTSIARRYWKRAGLEDRIELRIGPALDTLRALPAEPVLDLAFIDADKVSYPYYYEELVSRLRPGGLLIMDNVLLGGRVLDPDSPNPAALGHAPDERGRGQRRPGRVGDAPRARRGHAGPLGADRVSARSPRTGRPRGPARPWGRWPG